MKLVHDGQDVFWNQKREKFYVAGDQSFVEVPEATIAEGNYPEIPVDYVQARFERAGLPALAFSQGSLSLIEQRDAWGYPHYGRRNHKYQLRDGSYLKLDGEQVEQVTAIKETFRRYSRSNVRHSFDRHLQILRVGTVVTPQSLKKEAAKGKSAPPYTLQDHVEWKMRGKMITGVIKSWSQNGASILCEDEKKRVVGHHRLTRIDPPEVDESEFEDTLGASVMGNFRHVLAAMAAGELGVYRATVVKKKYKNPNDTHNRNQEVEKKAARCPLCPGELVNEHSWRETAERFQCSSCGTSMTVLKDNGNEIYFAMSPKAKVNTFCIEEARCCANCGRFYFEYGRQGKRSTGFCRDFKVTVLGHNTCKGWIPDEPDVFSTNMTQHIRNLGTAIGTHWNKESQRPYTKDDQKKDKAVAAEKRLAYEKAYQMYLKKLLEFGSKMPPAPAP